MSSRRASDGGSVLSFTFLDVLMCTMGSLLLLLVIMGMIAHKATRMRREGEVARISLEALTAPTAAAQAAAAAQPAVTESVPPVDAEKLAQQLEKIRSEEARIEELRRQAAERRREEQDRIAHLEDHERRLEHDLAKLHVTLQALEAAESEQTVDQEQAEAEVKRLQELVRETEQRLENMRKRGVGETSYAIVPYKGANGTFRRPVFVECTADAVTIQPEGIRLTVEDFDGPLRSGNPLAAAVRAAHEELNGRAMAAGQTDLPDPYPLLIVRPDGAAAYAAALDAIRSWDSDYGYEFVEADWKLAFPEPDPRLAQVMSHAVDEARQRQALLAKVAPRRYAPRLAGGAGGGGYGGDDGGDGGGFGALTSTGLGDRIGSRSGDGSFAGGGGDGGHNSLREGGGSTGSGGGNFIDEFAGEPAGASGLPGGGGGGTGGPGGTGTAGGGAGGPGSLAVGQGAAGAAGATGVGGDRYAAGSPGGTAAEGTATQSGQASAGQNASGESGGGAAGSAQTGGSNPSGEAGGNAADMAASGSNTSSGSAGSGSGGASGGNGGSGSPSSTSGSAGGSFGSLSSGPPSDPRRSAAATRGANWANAAAARRTSAITRPVRAIITADQLQIIPEGGTAADAKCITFQQPVDGVLDQLAAAVHNEVEQWGLAGDSMYWRPTLVVTVSPGAQRQARRLAELLDNSGIDVRAPQSTANASQGIRQ